MVCSVGHVIAFTFYALAQMPHTRPFFIPAKVEDAYRTVLMQHTAAAADFFTRI
jgi:hypothetical protein